MEETGLRRGRKYPSPKSKCQIKETLLRDHGCAYKYFIIKISSVFSAEAAEAEGGRRGLLPDLLWRPAAGG